MSGSPIDEYVNHLSRLSAFVAAKKKERWVELAGSPRGREKLRAGLPHFSDWNARSVHRFTADKQTCASVAEALRSNGAPEIAYVVSASRDLDGACLTLDHALRETVGRSNGTVVSCIPGVLAFYEGEMPGERYMLVVR